MASKIYQLSYDDQLDKDIHEWLKKIPRSRKAETVRHAIRYYIASNGGSSGIHMPNVTGLPIAIEEPQIKQEAPKKKRPKLSKDGDFS
ncbi:hypothetical protein [Bacillus cereus]|uniref:Uncharacterized protein n=1 Tax=Bacillus cereus TaxID=1396 RepID=A0A9X5VEA8_BACCE|nr:hypothetical protein [Bacillus cereus]AQQ66212.1 hypothetical Protein FORC21_5417 [Bacillus cereus]MCP1143057.1 hypothetical protein [Bacillus cereus]MDF9574106.1 hypothetical protein [Bacillus cereus]OJS95747.1 hypothetical protein BKK64_11105 [Bacillus cereus]SMD60429.1 hypothetical protein BACERE00196_00087 [Bacillus cereus]